MRPLVYLVGASVHDRASLCLAVSKLLHVMPVASLAELTPQTLTNVDAFLVWDQRDSIAQLKAHLSILDSRAPIIAIAEQPSARRIVRALMSGAVDYLEWPCSSALIREAVSFSIEAAERWLPLHQRAIEARRLLDRLSPRERQVLTAMAQGMSNQVIAALLEIEPRTVEMHRRDLLAKIEVTHSAEAIRLELEASLADHHQRGGWMAPWTLDKTLLRTG